jgi:hypothetical protein
MGRFLLEAPRDYGFSTPLVGLSWPKVDDMLSALTGVVGVNSAGIQAVFDLDQLTPVVREYHSARANAPMSIRMPTPESVVLIDPRGGRHSRAYGCGLRRPRSGRCR